MRKSCLVVVVVVVSLLASVLALVGLNAGPVSAQSDEIRFSPSVSISLAGLDDDGGVIGFVGAEFMVSFARVTDSNAGCSETVSEVWKIDDDGVVVRSGEGVVLVDRPAGSDSRCEYNAVFPTSAADGGLVLASGEPVVVSAGSQSASADYIRGRTVFSPAVSISVPDLDDDDDGINDFSGYLIRVIFNRVVSSDAGCTERVKETWEVDDDGFVARSGEGVVLVGYPQGADRRCKYYVRLSRTYLPSSWGRLVLASGGTGAVTAVLRQVDLVYVNRRSVFSPAVAISVPNIAGDTDYLGAEFRVGFSPVAGSDAKCSETASEVWKIDDDGVVARSGETAVLVNRPQGADSRCEYNAVFPTSAADGGLVLASGEPVVVSAGSVLASADYIRGRTVFSPAVSISVPDLDDDDDGINDFSGYLIRVIFNRVVSSDAGCTERVKETWEVDDDGVVARSGEGVVLVGYSEGADRRCKYYVRLSRTYLPSSWGRLVLASGGTGAVTAVLRQVDLVYVNRRSVFSPVVAISVPNIAGDTDYLGAEFRVGFSPVAGSDARCSETASEVWKIGDSGVAARSGETAVLVNRPEGGDSRCEYNAVFPTSAADGGLVLASGGTGVVSAGSVSVAGVYTYTRSVFSPAVDISVPDLDDNDDGINDFSGYLIRVIFNRLVSSDAGCTERVKETWGVDDDGVVARSGEGVVLVGYSEGAARRCKYYVRLSLSYLPSSWGRLVLASGGTGVVSTVSRQVDLVYVNRRSVFSPAVAISVPNIAGDTDYLGAEFRVGFSPVAGSDAGCSETASETWKIDDDWVMSRSGATAVLVNRPQGADSRCEYNVEFPTSAADGGLVRASGGSVVVSAASVSASADYISSRSVFSPAVDILVPNFDDDGEVNGFVGKTIVVRFVSVAGSEVGCVSEASEVWKIGDRGVVIRQGRGAVLVDRPVGATDSCKYDVRLPDTIAGSVRGLALVPAEPVVVSAASVSVAAVYMYGRSVFSPDVTLTVLGLDENNDGINHSWGTTIDVRFSRVPGSDVGCTETILDSWDVDSSGLVSQFYEDILLVDRPAGIARPCEYDVTLFIFFNPDNRLLLESVEADIVSATSRLVTVVYVNTRTVVAPVVAISVPEIDENTDYSGAEFWVRFVSVAGSDAGCTETASEVWKIGDDGVVVRSGEVAVLVDRPVGVADRCEYDVVFPDSVGDLVLPWGESVVVSAASVSVAAAYVNTQTVFEPVVGISVPDLDEDNDGANDFSGTSFEVRFVPVAGSDVGCTQMAQETWLVGSGGVVVRSGGGAVLVEFPQGAGSRCEYNAVFTSSVADGSLVRASGGPFVVSAASVLVSVGYVSSRSVFSPAVAIKVPDFDGGGDATGFVGAEFRVRFVPVAGSAAGCVSEASEVWKIGDGGVVVRSGGGAVLADHPVGATDSCEYDVVFPDTVAGSVRGLALVPAGSVVVSAASVSVAAVYMYARSVFSPVVAITVPSFDDNDDGNNDFSGTSFDVSFAPVAGSAAGCTETASGTWVVESDGSVTRRFGEGVVLVSYPQGAGSRCEYNAVFPDSVRGLALESGGADIVSAASRLVALAYVNTRSFFSPVVAISVPDIDEDTDYSGAEFRVRFVPVAGSDVGCIEINSEVWKIGDGGVAARSGETALLVDRPVGVADHCEYNAAFPVSVGGSVLPWGEPVVVSAASVSVAAVYVNTQTRFSPVVAISVPDIDEDNDGANDFSGTSFEVSFAPVAGSAAGCTQMAQETWLVGSGGVVTRSGETAVLEEFPQGAGSRCEYNAVVTSSVADGSLVRVSGGPVLVSAASVLVSVGYVSSRSVFSPAVAILVPDFDDDNGEVDGFVGAEFRVRFVPVAGSGVGCVSEASEVWKIGDGRVVVRSGGGAVLADQPVGATDSCEYTVVFPETVAGSVRGLALMAAEPVVVSAASVSVAAVYMYARSVFSPVVAITVPSFDDNNDGNNDYWHTRINVSFRRVWGSDSGCTKTASGTWGVESDGSVTRRLGRGAVLVGYPEGVASRCKYYVTSRTSYNSDRGLIQKWGRIIIAASRSVDLVYVNARTVFSPVVAISVPDIDEDDDGSNDFSGTSFVVSFVPVAGSDVGCTETASEVWKVGDGGVVARSGATAVLVARPERVDSRCEYNVVFPDSVGGSVLPWSEPVVISSASVSVAAVYVDTQTMFSPVVAISVPDLDEDDDGSNDFSGTSFVVSFVPVAGSDTACTSEASETWVVGSGGVVARSGGGAVLVEFPQGAGSRCEYNAVLAPSVADGALVRASGGPFVVSAASGLVSVGYVSSRSVFSPDVVISVPDFDDDNGEVEGFVGAEFVVSFVSMAGSDVGCVSEASEVWKIGDGGVVVRSGGGAVLADRPVGAASRCAYNVVFPETVAGSVRGLILMSARPVVVRAPFVSVVAVYMYERNVFSPVVAITVPDIDDNLDGRNDFLYNRIYVRFAPVAGSDVGCTQMAKEIWRVNSNGSVTRPGEGVVLVGHPEGVAGRCEYDVRLSIKSIVPIYRSHNSDKTLILVSGGADIVSAASRLVDLVYVNARTVLVPVVTISVPDFDEDTDYSGAEFWVRFVPVAGSDTGCTETASEVWKVGDGGVLTRLGEVAVLVARPERADSRCEYNVVFPDSVGDLVLPWGGPFVVNAASVSVAAAYVNTQTVFSPVVAISVPDLDEDNDGANDFSGTSFEVSFAPVAGSDVGCTQMAKETWLVGSGGVVVRSGGGAVLVEFPQGAGSRCEYNAVFTSSVADGALVRASGGPFVVSAAFELVSVGYVGSRSVFSPDVAISVPNFDGDGEVTGFVGKTILVRFVPVAGSDVGCVSEASEVWKIGDGGVVARAGGGAVLLDRPVGATGRCEYDVVFPETVAGSVRGLTLVAAEPVVASAASVSAAGVYMYARSVFAPVVAITVPDIDDNDDGNNDFWNTRIDVRFTPVAGSEAGCTETASEIWWVESDGVVARWRFGGVAVLVDRPVGVASRCEYDVVFALSVADGVLVLASGGSVVVSPISRFVAAVYVNARTFFSPAVDILVPDFDDDGGITGFVGEEFVVRFVPVMGSDVGCFSEASEVWVIGDGGVVERSGEGAVLVDRPEGAGSRCAYNAVFSPSVADGALVLVSDSSAVVSGVAASVVASYGAVGTVFEPIVTISVPDFDDDGDGYNDFSGTSFEVTFAPAAGSDTGCTSDASENLKIGDSKFMVQSGGGTVLVDRPEGVAGRCLYDVVFVPSVAEGVLVLVSDGSVVVSAASISAAAVYINSQTEFFPVAAISVPGFDDDGDGANDFSGTSFEVTFSRVAGSDAGCTGSVREIWRVSDSGVTARQSEAISLVDRPEGVEVRCAYDVEFSVLGSAAEKLVLVSGGSVAVSGVAVSVVAIYGTVGTFFETVVVISVPDFDGDGDGVNDFSGISFAVTFSRVADSNTGCTGSVREIWRVSDSGVAARQSEAISLVDRPEGVDGRCAYDVEFSVLGSAAEKLVLVSGGSVAVSGVAVSVVAIYGTVEPVFEPVFEPVVAISVPGFDDDGDGVNDFSGISFAVTFRSVAGSEAGCTSSASETWVIRDGGVVIRQDEAVVLVDRPEGVDVRCVYDVEFSVLGSAAQKLVLESGSPAVISAAAASVSVSYGTVETVFEPVVAVMVPDFDEDGDGVNDFSGISFAVTFRSVAGSEAGCTSWALEAWRVRDSGVVIRQDEAVVLVDRPEGVDVRCVYDVEFSVLGSAAQKLVLESGSPAVISAAAASATANYANSQ